MFEQIKVFMCEDQIWLDVLKICYTKSKLQWSNPKHTFCLWKLGEDIHQSIIEFLVFLVKDFDSRSLTISAESLLGALALLSFTGASQIAFCNAEDEVTTAGVEEAPPPRPQLPRPLPLPPKLAPVPNWLQGLTLSPFQRKQTLRKAETFARQNWKTPTLSWNLAVCPTCLGLSG